MPTLKPGDPYQPSYKKSHAARLVYGCISITDFIRQQGRPWMELKRYTKKLPLVGIWKEQDRFIVKQGGPLAADYEEHDAMSSGGDSDGDDNANEESGAEEDGRNGARHVDEAHRGPAKNPDSYNPGDNGMVPNSKSKGNAAVIASDVVQDDDGDAVMVNTEDFPFRIVDGLKTDLRDWEVPFTGRRTKDLLLELWKPAYRARAATAKVKACTPTDEDDDNEAQEAGGKTKTKKGAPNALNATEPQPQKRKRTEPPDDTTNKRRKAEVFKGVDDGADQDDDFHTGGAEPRKIGKNKHNKAVNPRTVEEPLNAPELDDDLLIIGPVDIVDGEAPPPTAKIVPNKPANQTVASKHTRASTSKPIRNVQPRLRLNPKAKTIVMDPEDLECGGSRDDTETAPRSRSSRNATPCVTAPMPLEWRRSPRSKSLTAGTVDITNKPEDATEEKTFGPGAYRDPKVAAANPVRHKVDSYLHRPSDEEARKMNRNVLNSAERMELDWQLLDIAYKDAKREGRPWPAPKPKKEVWKYEEFASETIGNRLIENGGSIGSMTE